MGGQNSPHLTYSLQVGLLWLPHPPEGPVKWKHAQTKRLSVRRLDFLWMNEILRHLETMVVTIVLFVFPLGNRIIPGFLST